MMHWGLPVLAGLSAGLGLRVCDAEAGLRRGLATALATTALGVWLAAGTTLAWGLLCTGLGLLALFIVAAMVDMRSRVIPHRIDLAVMGMGMCAMLALPAPHWGMRLATGGALLVLFGLVAWMTGGMGWGDVKFSGALGFALGWPYAVCTMAVGMILAGLWAAALRLRHRGPEGLPLAPFLAVGGILSLWLMMHWNTMGSSIG